MTKRGSRKGAKTQREEEVGERRYMECLKTLRLSVLSEAGVSRIHPAASSASRCSLFGSHGGTEPRSKSARTICVMPANFVLILLRDSVAPGDKLFGSEYRQADFHPPIQERQVLTPARFVLPGIRSWLSYCCRTVLRPVSMRRRGPGTWSRPGPGVMETAGWL